MFLLPDLLFQYFLQSHQAPIASSKMQTIVPKMEPATAPVHVDAASDDNGVTLSMLSNCLPFFLFQIRTNRLLLFMEETKSDEVFGIETIRSITFHTYKKTSFFFALPGILVFRQHVNRTIEKKNRHQLFASRRTQNYKQLFIYFFFCTLYVYGFSELNSYTIRLSIIIICQCLHFDLVFSYSLCSKTTRAAPINMPMTNSIHYCLKYLKPKERKRRKLF